MGQYFYTLVRSAGDRCRHRREAGLSGPGRADAAGCAGVHPVNESHNRRIVLVERPDWHSRTAPFRTRRCPARVHSRDGEFLVRNRYLSDRSCPARLGQCRRQLFRSGADRRRHAVARGRGRRRRRSNPSYAVGEHLYGWFGWQDYCVRPRLRRCCKRVDPSQGPLSTALGVLGINGITAYLALTRSPSPWPARRSLVSTAAGAVGSLVGQLARRRGCRVVGSRVRRKSRALRRRIRISRSDRLSQRSGRGALAGLCPRRQWTCSSTTPRAPSRMRCGRMLNVARARRAMRHRRRRVMGSAAAGPRRDRDMLVKRIRSRGLRDLRSRRAIRGSGSDPAARDSRRNAESTPRTSSGAWIGRPPRWRRFTAARTRARRSSSCDGEPAAGLQVGATLVRRTRAICG